MGQQSTVIRQNDRIITLLKEIKDLLEVIADGKEARKEKEERVG